MTDYLGNLIARTVGTARVIQPRVASTFEPPALSVPSLAGHMETVGSSADAYEADAHEDGEPDSDPVAFRPTLARSDADVGSDSETREDHGMAELEMRPVERGESALAENYHERHGELVLPPRTQEGESQTVHSDPSPREPVAPGPESRTASGASRVEEALTDDATTRRATRSEATRDSRADDLDETLERDSFEDTPRVEVTAGHFRDDPHAKHRSVRGEPLIARVGSTRALAVAKSGQPIGSRPGARPGDDDAVRSSRLAAARVLRRVGAGGSVTSPGAAVAQPDEEKRGHLGGTPFSELPAHADGARPPEVSERHSGDAHNVNVTIGRIEVRAVPPAAAAPPRPEPRPRSKAPMLSLDDYVRRRARGGGV